MNNDRQRWVDLSQSLLKKKEPKTTEFDKMFYELEKALDETKQVILPVLKAGGAAKPQDRQNLRHLVFSCLMEKVDRFSKDELVSIITSVFADRLMQDVENNPWGGDKPDLLSGQ